MKSHHTIIHGDSREMNLLPSRSEHLVVTSPPYWQLKDYGTENQIGFHESDINICHQFARSVYGVERYIVDLVVYFLSKIPSLLQTNKPDGIAS